MATTNQSTPLCEQCSASGLPILPVRYTVVPKDVQPTLPGWASGNRVKDVALGADFQYALRTLREGYVYLFYSKNARGSNIWECYAVGQDGCLRLQPSPMMCVPQTAPDFSCTRAGHTNTAVHYVVIEQPNKCGPTWIAFSATKWSDETIVEYASNTKLRNARMQTIHPAQMAKGSKHEDGVLANKAALEAVIEYSPSFTDDTLPYDPVAADFSWEDGSFVTTRLEKMSTRYPWHLRKNEAESTVKHMKARGTSPKGDNPPHVLALWDAIGMSHELNGFRNDGAGWIKKYGDERELQITAFNAIEGTRKALEQRTKDRWDDLARKTANMPDFEEYGLRTQAGQLYGKDDPAKLLAPLYQLDQKYKEGQISETDYKAQRSQIFADQSSNPAEMEKVYEKIDAHRKERATRRTDNLAKNKSHDIAEGWKKYEGRLDKAAFDGFKQKWDALLVEADKILDRRTEALVNWLEAPLFIDTLGDFNTSNIEDGVMFEDAVGDAIFGMGSSKAGQKKIDEWVKEAKASSKTNLLWRAVALNQQEGIVEVDAALRTVYGGQVKSSSSNWDNMGAQIKWNKLADLTKKSLTLFNTQMKAVNDATSGIRALETTRGLDKIFMTVGGRWMTPFNWTVDTINELTLRTLLFVRSGGEPLAAKTLAAWDAVHSSTDRDMLIRRLLNQDHYLSAAAQASYKADAERWAALRANADLPDAKRQSFNAARDARLSLIVAIFEAFNLYKASAKAAKEPDSERVQAQLTATKYATTAAAIDVLSNLVKGVAAAGDRAVSYQALKFGGGALSVIASGYGAALDWGDAKKAGKASDYRMAMLFGIRGAFQLTSALLTALTALSYCSPLIETFGKKFGQRLAGRAIGWAAERLLLGRAALMLAGMEVSIFLLFVTGVIWYFEDDALEKWSDRCAFGLRRNKLSDKYPNADTQLKAYFDALKDVS